MHDLTYANKIITVLKGTFSGKDLEKRIVVNVVLGPFTHVTEASLRAAFQALAEKEHCRGVVLNVTKQEALVKCRKCAFVIRCAKPVFICSQCGHQELDLLNTEEFLIQSIEIEE